MHQKYLSDRNILKIKPNLPVSTGYEGIWKPSDFKGRSLKK
jgi:hypothetical protein